MNSPFYLSVLRKKCMHFRHGHKTRQGRLWFRQRKPNTTEAFRLRTKPPDRCICKGKACSRWTCEVQARLGCVYNNRECFECVSAIRNKAELMARAKHFAQSVGAFVPINLCPIRCFWGGQRLALRGMPIKNSALLLARMPYCLSHG